MRVLTHEVNHRGDPFRQKLPKSMRTINLKAPDPIPAGPIAPRHPLHRGIGSYVRKRWTPVRCAT